MHTRRPPGQHKRPTKRARNNGTLCGASMKKARLGSTGSSLLDAAIEQSFNSVLSDVHTPSPPRTSPELRRSPQPQKMLELDHHPHHASEDTHTTAASATRGTTDRLEKCRCGMALKRFRINPRDCVVMCPDIQVLLPSLPFPQTPDFFT
mmetsp:Transcript_22615/g.42481  ORF Transcript_22615/g.42481 Transcript_22615/m.42481 type:complete len:150 (+) Transcript_22615:212-661(+)